MACINACLAFWEAIRPKFFGVTSTSSSSFSWALGLWRSADSRLISLCLSVTLSTTIREAKARMSPSLRSISHLSSLAGPTARFAAETIASSTALIRISRSRPFSRSQYSMLAINSAFIVIVCRQALNRSYRTKKPADCSPTSLTLNKID